MTESKAHEELVNEIKKTISPHFSFLLIEDENAIGKIQIFDEKVLRERKQNRFKIAEADIMVLDDKENPFLVIEPETSSSPKTFGRSIPVYAVAQSVKVGNKKYLIESPLLLLVVIPKQKNDSQKDKQLPDLERKLKETIDFGRSNLRDFAFCQISDLRPTLKWLFESNGYDKYACYIG